MGFEPTFSTLQYYYKSRGRESNSHCQSNVHLTTWFRRPVNLPRQGVLMKECENVECSKEYHPYDSRSRYCSRSCAATVNNRKSPKRKPEGMCGRCDTEISTRYVFCNSCRIKGDRWEHITIGELASLTHGYRVNDRIRTLARTIYRRSSKPKECIVCGYDKHYHVCHIQSIQSFSSDTPISVVNDLSNLEARCPNHHWELG